ncbi:MAG: arsenite methyltransferase [Actinobacteria bacterium]|nr:arsenite methyltransferase [Actinomycetota bacterium]
MARTVIGEAGSDGCCTPVDAEAVALYDLSTRGEVPEEALLASLGCGNPTAVAELREGETVLDLGSGGGIDVLLSARRVGASGEAIGLDMTDEMLELARANAAKAGARNVRFLKGYMEDIPLPDAAVDVVISNCVINLSVDKPRVFVEMFRVLRPGGRLGIADIVAADELSMADRAERGSYAGCIAGALSFAEYREGLEAAGFEGVDLEPTHEAAEGIFGTIVRATKPS